MSKFDWSFIVVYSILSLVFNPFLVALIAVGLVVLFVFFMCASQAVTEERSMRCAKVGHDLKSGKFQNGERLVRCTYKYCYHREFKHSPDACLEVTEDDYDA